MFLKSLTLKGFKSFADSTTLELEPGITVVVGPNGSGKSNIVDAVAWVLGAQGPRTLRSSKMEDVIFAGTGKRAPLGRAEVTLTIDNSAGLLPIEFAEVTLTRTLWRSGESEYAINGVPCRLLDVQELLSDSGVGRQQHVIVSQGQLDGVLNAQPTDRRLIIEEAAGVLKFRRRREKAQRRLEATEGNLLRVQDLLREVRRQLRPLERQAEAARRHGDVVTELSALRLHLAGRELSALRARAETVARVRSEVAGAETSVLAVLSRLDAGVLEAEVALSAAGESDLGDLLGRLEGLRERARGVVALIGERGRSIGRLRSSSVDHDLVASLEAEAASVAAELPEVDAEIARLNPQAEELAASEAELEAELSAFEREDPFRQTPAAAEVRGELAALRGVVERARVERQRLEFRVSGLQAKAARMAEEGARLEGELEALATAEGSLVEAADRAMSARTAAEGELAEVERAFAEMDVHHRSWVARSDALALALDEARAGAGAERLADVEGLVGTLLDVVEVDAGWESAFEAALGEAMASVIVDGVESAKRALAHLHDQSQSGSVVALGMSAPPGPHPEVDRCTTSASGVEALRPHVHTALPGVAALLDHLLAAAVVVDGAWEAALDVTLAHAGLVVTTRDGDRFAAAGWRTGAGSLGATAAALDDARQRAAQASRETAAARDRVVTRREVLEASRRTELAAVRELDRHDSQLSGATEALKRAEGEQREAATEIDAVTAQLAELVERLGRDEARALELDELLPALEAEEAAGVERAVAIRAARSRLDQRQAAVRSMRTDHEVRYGGLGARRNLLAQRLASLEDRLAGVRDERDDAHRRRVQLDEQALALDRLGAVASDRLGVLEDRVTHLREQRRRQTREVHELSAGLDQLRSQRVGAERELTTARERGQRAELDDAEIRLRLETAADSLRREFDCDPDTAMAAACPDLPPATTAERRARELERDLRLMGPINPLALEEYSALQERHTFLEAQLEDVKGGRRELAKIIRAIDTEIVEVFSAAYADVADNFSTLFATLFPGGTGRLRLTDPDNLLETGIEVEARPSGKNVKRLSLLSGGERSLTAMAYLFAVFRSRPSPFYLMDEVEAALDDVNLHRFLDLIREFREEAQLVIVSHQKRTMEAADCLYGVTMQSAGSSRVVSERVHAGA